MAPRKNRLSERFKLSERGFFYDDCVTENPLPQHAENLRQSMLDFAFQNLEIDTNIVNDDLTKERAERLSRGGYSEEQWKIFYREKFFSPIEQITSNPSGSRSDSEVTWVTFNNTGLDDTIPGALENEKQPKPDYGFYLPMYHLENECYIPETNEHKGLKWHKNATPSIVESFSWSVLKELYEHGLRPSPLGIFDGSNKEPRENDLKCFPWLVVEFKKQDESENVKREVYRQAVNASGCAVRLNQIAAKYAVELVDEAHVPPIPVVTTIGSTVKVWITYHGKRFLAYHDDNKWRQCNREHGGYVMQCVWEGDMTQPRDIVSGGLHTPVLVALDIRVERAVLDGGLACAYKAIHNHIPTQDLK
ncbi:hypothetical protein FLONG3_6547 [Fusarium longipes]|uniref:Uncharacterized protein n=1 Tax=Fusarium longipes TaxID=694270 RepID=A0A395SLD2_9HYPO|nr:hypothetical protein FLONG3_6547 [Fusarium longipes]